MLIIVILPEVNMIWYEEHIPSRMLQPYIKLYYLISVVGKEDASDVQRVTPDGCCELNFMINTSILRTELSGEQEHLTSDYLVSRHRHTHFLEGSENVMIYGIRFQPWGLTKFTDYPVSYITDGITDPKLIFSKDYSAFKNSIYNSNGIEDYIKLTEAFLGNELRKQHDHNCERIVIDLAKRIQTEHGRLNIRTEYNHYGISERRIQQRFSEMVGVSPKYYSRIMRYQSVLKELKNSELTSLTALAYKCSYADQSHFISEFKSFSGLSPLKFRKERHTLNDLIAYSSF